MKKSDAIYLHHILDAIAQIEEYLDGVFRNQFMQTKLLQDGVARELEIIGEASRNLSDEFRQKNTDVPWGEIVGLRNRLIHAYFSVSSQIVWEIVQNDLPSLKKDVEDLLKDL